MGRSHPSYASTKGVDCMKIVLSLCVSLFIMVGVANAQYPVYGVAPGPIDATDVQPTPLPRVQTQLPKAVPLAQRQPDIFHYHLHEFAAQPRNDGHTLNPYGCYQRDMCVPQPQYYVPQYNPCVPQCQPQFNQCLPQAPVFYMVPQQRSGARVNVFGWQQ